MARTKLTKTENEIIRLVADYGGFITCPILNLYKKELKYDSCYRILRKMEQKKLLIRRLYYLNVETNPIVYQISSGACNFLNKGNADLRKVKNKIQIRRRLIRAHYLFQLAGSGNTISYPTSLGRINYLRYRGFTNYQIPTFSNYGKEGTINTRFQVEEYILDKSPYTRSNNICFVYFDYPQYAPAVQLETLINRYLKMEKIGRAFLDFIIVTETEKKAKEFTRIYKGKYQDRFSMLDLTATYLGKTYEII